MSFLRGNHSLRVLRDVPRALSASLYNIPPRQWSPSTLVVSFAALFQRFAANQASDILFSTEFRRSSNAPEFGAPRKTSKCSGHKVEHIHFIPFKDFAGVPAGISAKSFAENNPVIYFNKKVRPRILVFEEAGDLGFCVYPQHHDLVSESCGRRVVVVVFSF